MTISTVQEVNREKLEQGYNPMCTIPLNRISVVFIHCNKQSERPEIRRDTELSEIQLYVKKEIFETVEIATKKNIRKNFLEIEIANVFKREDMVIVLPVNEMEAIKVD